jgi:uncharacterized membrane protein
MLPVKETARVNSPLAASKATRRVWMGALALSLMLVALPWLVRLDGKPHGDLEQFLGRFHPLVVHLPIGFLILVPVLEVAGRFRPALREAAGFVLGLAFASCLLSLGLGFLLAHGGGSAGPAVTLHMWGGIVLTICTMLCLLARPWWAGGRAPYAYPALLVCCMLALVWTAHLGGSITHGANYLTQYMPAGLKRWIPGGAPTSDSFFVERINPILDSNCVTCHGASQAKGGLRMDSYDQLMKGGTDGAVIFAGKPDSSLLLERVTLSPGHKGFMPAEGRPPLRAEEISWIRAWIQDGASASARAVAGVSIRDQQKEPPPPPVGDYSALMPAIEQMDQAQGAKLRPVSSKPEDGLVLYTVDIAPQFGDAQLAQLLKFAPYIVEADLARTAVTNASFATLAQFTHLRALHLEGTAVTGDGLSKLTQLTQLTYLNLSGTKVSPAAAQQLSSFRNLRHVYLYNTPAQPLPTAAQTNATAEK